MSLQDIANVYQLLGRLWSREADAELLATMQSCERLNSAISAANDDLASLAVDYCQLFVGPTGHLPPVQSVWEDGRFRGEVEASVRRFASCLHEPVSSPSIEADHLGNQLQLMGAILSTPAATADETAARQEMAAAFFAHHLCWTDSLLRLAANQAQTDFYRQVIETTTEFLSAEQSFWREVFSA